MIHRAGTRGSGDQATGAALALAGLIVVAAMVCSAGATAAAAATPVVEVLPTGDTAPLFADHSFAAPPAWRVRPLPGRSAGGSATSFLPVLYYSTFAKSPVQTPQGSMRFSDQPWARDAIVRVRVDELMDPTIWADLKGRPNPLMIFGEGVYGEPYMYPGRSPADIDAYFKYLAGLKKTLGPRLLCWDYGEWSWGGVEGGKTTRELPASCQALGIQPPANLDQAGEWFSRRYDSVFKRPQDDGIPVFSWNATSLNHYEARKGATITGNEIAYINAAMDSTLIAFCRGASRQFGIPWGVYAAGYGGVAGAASFWNSISPNERRLEGFVRGPYSAVPMQEQRRTLYTALMAGADFSIKENDGSQGMLSGYDPATVDRTDPRVIALQDPKTYAGPYAQLWSELYDTVVAKRRDRGTTYTPIALLLDANHGFVFKYSQTLALGGVPYTAAEEQIRAVVSTIFPWESDQYAAGPFGEIFDVITTDAPEPVIGSYRAIVLAGRPRVDARLAGVLRDHVQRGGLLVMACEQMTPELWKLAGCSDSGEIGQDSSFLRASDFYVYQQQPAFEYHKVRLDGGARPLFVAGTYEQRSWPVATINRVGKGALIVGTPVWMGVKGDPTRMHGVFGEILAMIADELAPVQVIGGIAGGGSGSGGAAVKVMYNRNAAGWVVTLMNPHGTTIVPPGYRPATRQRDTAAVILRPRFAVAGGSASEWISGRQWTGLDQPDATIALDVPPGEIRIVELPSK